MTTSPTLASDQVPELVMAVPSLPVTAALATVRTGEAFCTTLPGEPMSEVLNTLPVGLRLPSTPTRAERQLVPTLLSVDASNKYRLEPLL